MDVKLYCCLPCPASAPASLAGNRLFYSSTVKGYNTATIQALALQPAVWGISCLVLLPSPCNDSACTYRSAIFVKPQQWPTPSESIAIYCVRKLVSCVTHLRGTRQSTWTSPVATGALVDLASPNKLQAPQIETWNTKNQWSLSVFGMSIPLHKRKALYWTLSCDGSDLDT